MYILYFIFNLFRIVPAWLIIGISSDKKVIWEDFNRYKTLNSLSGGKYYALGLLLLRKPEFRSLVIYRLKNIIEYFHLYSASFSNRL